MSSSYATLSTAGLAAAMLALAPAALAKPTLSASRTAVAQAISDCRQVADRDARLACYDKAADAFEQAQAAGQVVVVDRAQVQAVKRQAFGISMPSLTLFNRGPKEETLDKISVALAGAHQEADGKWVLTTDENATWRQIDNTELYNPPHSGSTMVVRKAMLGSFFCKVDGGAAIRCTRSQ